MQQLHQHHDKRKVSDGEAPMVANKRSKRQDADSRYDDAAPFCPSDPAHLIRNQRMELVIASLNVSELRACLLGKQLKHLREDIVACARSQWDERWEIFVQAYDNKIHRNETKLIALASTASSFDDSASYEEAAPVWVFRKVLDLWNAVFTTASLRALHMTCKNLASLLGQQYLPSRIYLRARYMDRFICAKHRFLIPERIIGADTTDYLLSPLFRLREVRFTRSPGLKMPQVARNRLPDSVESIELPPQFFLKNAFALPDDLNELSVPCTHRQFRFDLLPASLVSLKCRCVYRETCIHAPALPPSLVRLETNCFSTYAVPDSLRVLKISSYDGVLSRLPLFGARSRIEEIEISCDAFESVTIHCSELPRTLLRFKVSQVSNRFAETLMYCPSIRVDLRDVPEGLRFLTLKHVDIVHSLHVEDAQALQNAKALESLRLFDVSTRTVIHLPASLRSLRLRNVDCDWFQGKLNSRTLRKFVVEADTPHSIVSERAARSLIDQDLPLRIDASTIENVREMFLTYAAFLPEDIDKLIDNMFRRESTNGLLPRKLSYHARTVL